MKKHPSRRFQSNRKTGLLFVSQDAYDRAMAKMTDIKCPTTFITTPPPDLPYSVVAGRDEPEEREVGHE